jgi:hypothetical protein
MDRPSIGFETTGENSSSDADGIAVDTEGYLWWAARVANVCDQTERVVAILSKPQPAWWESNHKGTVAWAPAQPPVPLL